MRQNLDTFHESQRNSHADMYMRKDGKVSQSFLNNDILNFNETQKLRHLEQISPPMH